MPVATATVSINRTTAERVLRPALTAELTRRAIQVQSRASELCPVDTGRLRASITYQVVVDKIGPVARIGSNVEYAIFVELGTSRMEAQPFLRPALTGAGGGFTAKAGSGVAKIAHGLGREVRQELRGVTGL